MNASVTRKNSVTTPKMASVCMENFRSGKQLEADLARLEQERRSKLRQLNQESKLFVDIRLKSARSGSKSPPKGSTLPFINHSRENSFHSDNSLSPSPSASPRSPSSSPPKSRSPSPRPLRIRKSLSVEESKQQTSPNSSPESQRRLLSKRCSSPNPKAKSHNIIETTVVPLSHAVKQNDTRNSSQNATKTTEWTLRRKSGLIKSGISLIPEIVVNDLSAKNSVGKESSKENISNADKQKNECKLDTTDGSLAVPMRTRRRNSAPSVPFLPSYLQHIAKKESTFTTEDIEGDVRGSTPRGRSSSVCVPYFNHLKDAPRRDSLIKKYVAKRGTYRRTAVTLERLISDLAKGVHHSELLNKNYGNSSISLDEWEKLKECRYLRRPSRDYTATENTIDVEAIFASSDTISKQ